MRIARLTSKSALIATAVLLGAAEAPAAEKLSDLMRKSGWDRVVGTWVDADTKGAAYKVTYQWKIPDRVIEVTTEEGSKRTVSLMGVNARDGSVFSMGADSEGGSALGKWSESNDGDAVLELLFTTGDRQQGALRLRYHLEGNDKLIITLEGPQPIKIRLVRATPKG